MSELPLVEGIYDIIDKENIPLCMPGHKSGRGFFDTPEGTKLAKRFISCDITEIDGADNLHHPEGIIKDALDRLAKFYHSKKAYFLVNGSTSGNMAMIFSSFKEGDKVIVERNCHRSIYNSILLRKLVPVFIQSRIDDDFDAVVKFPMESFKKLIYENKDAKGVIVTYPNYYGVCPPLAEIIKLSHESGMVILVDSAHGAHFGVCDELPESAVKLGADMAVLSAHKTLPSLTQTAFLCVNNVRLIEKTDFYVSTFLSTSPSYLFMCSMDYARFYLEKKGKVAYKNLINMVLHTADRINALGYVHILDETDAKLVDRSRMVLRIKKGYSAKAVYDFLLKNGIQPEMCDGRNIVLIFSPFEDEADFEKVYEVLRDCRQNLINEEYVPLKYYSIPKLELLPYEVLDMPSEEIPIENSLGRIAAKAVVPYPPGVPILNLGEKVDDGTINMILYYLKNGIDIFGLNVGKIKVLEINS